MNGFRHSNPLKIRLTSLKKVLFREVFEYVIALGERD
jgi:hypothetical protein